MKKNEIIRQHLADTAQERRSKNCFRYGAVEVRIDHDSPWQGIEFPETISISIYDPVADRDIVLTANIDALVIVNNALFG